MRPDVPFGGVFPGRRQHLARIEVELKGIGGHHDALHQGIDPGRVERCIGGGTGQRPDGYAAHLAQRVHGQALRGAGLRPVLPLVGALVVALLELGELAAPVVWRVGEGVAAVAAHEPSGEARGAPPPDRAEVAPTLALGLDPGMQPVIDDRRVGALYFEAGELAAVEPLAMGDVVVHEGPLEDAEAAVLLLVQDAHDGGLAEGHSLSVEDPPLRQRVGYLGERHAVGEGAVHEPHRVGLIGDNLEPVAGPPVAVHAVGQEGALGEALSDAPLDVLADGQALLLRVRGEDGEHQLPVAGERVEALALESHRDAHRLQAPHGVQQVDGVSREAADGLGEDDVYHSFPAVGDEPLELDAMSHTRAGDARVRIHPGVVP